MDIRHLTYFLEVAKHRNFTKASDALHVSQPTISKMVKNLEEELGVTLLDRSGKHIELTDAGEVVFAQAQQIVNSLHNLSGELADVMHMRKGHIRIGIPPMVGAPFFPRVLAEFHRLYPQITIELTEDGAKDVEQMIEEGLLDLGVTVLPVEAERFESFAFVKENLRLLVHPTHRLAGVERVDFADLREEPFILFREGFALHDRIPEVCLRAGFTPHVIYESSQWDFMSEMVAANLGVALLPETICKTLSPERIKTLIVENPSIPWHLAVIWKKERYLSYASREWIRFTREFMQHHQNLNLSPLHEKM